MRRLCMLAAATFGVLLGAAAVRAEVKVDVDRNDLAHATPEFHFKVVPPPSKDDAATGAKFKLADGQKDDNAGELAVLHDGKLPANQDEPESNFFFDAGTDGGRIVIDLGSATDVRQVNTYSWHTDTRAAQVYALYGADGTAAGFNVAPGKGVDPTTCGWKLLANVDTRPKSGEPGGQYGVSVSDSAGALGKFRYVLLAASRTEADDDFGNTFYSEVDVVAGKELLGKPAPADGAPGVKLVRMGRYSATIDTTETPDLTEWADTQLAPTVAEWYPKLAAMLPSPGYEAPAHFSITFRANKPGVADTMGTRVNCAAAFFRQTLNTQAKGAIVHEMVHVVQNYGIANRTNRHPQPNPGWLVEGLADYVRWYLYEPASHGTDIRARNADHVRYDDSYRVTANFLNYVVVRYDHDLIRQLNATMRAGNYDPEVWHTLTGKGVDELGAEWKTSLTAKAAG
jgi:hypothetical protein